MKRAAVTGGTGFVGANLARRLLDEGHEVHLLVRPGFAPWRIASIRPHVHVHVVDLLDPESLHVALRTARPDWVFHLAAHGAYSSQVDTQAILTTNVLGTASLLEAAHRVGFESLVNTGSSSEYGFVDHAPSEEESAVPNSVYAVSKVAATHFCRYFAERYALPVTTLRLYSVYGPFEEPGRLMPTLLRHALSGRLPPLASPTVARDFVYTTDVENAYLRAASHGHNAPGAIFNIGTGVQTSLADLVSVVKRRFQVHDEPRWSALADRQWDTSTWVANPRLAREVLGWEASISLADGLEQFARWLTDSAEGRVRYGC